VILSRPRDQKTSRRDRPGTLRDGDDVMITGMVVVALPLAPLVVAVMFLSDEHERKSK
jgi:Na+-transporting methylmalonyl-CoA/oxaloacetate decarboxylase gamma subunit